MHVSNRIAAIILVLTAIVAIALQILPTGQMIVVPGKAFPVSSYVHSNLTDPNTGSLVGTTVAIYGSPLGAFILDHPAAEASPWAFIATSFDSEREIIPLESYVGANATKKSYELQSAREVEEANVVPLIAAFELKHENYTITGKGVRVLSLSEEGFAKNFVQVYDIIKSVDGVPVYSVVDVQQALSNKTEAVLLLERGASNVTVSVPLKNGKLGVAGVAEGISVVSARNISISIDGFSGESMDVLLALDVLSRLDERDVTRGKIIAGTGGLQTNGTILPVEGLRLKIATAERTGADIFLLPVSQYNATLKEEFPSIVFVPAGTLEEAYNALQ